MIKGWFKLTEPIFRPMFFASSFHLKNNQGTSLKHLVATKALTNGTWALQELAPPPSPESLSEELLMASAALARIFPPKI